MPPMNVLKAAARLNRALGDRRDYPPLPPEAISGPEAGLMVCEKCGAALLVGEVPSLALCACGEPLNRRS